MNKKEDTLSIFSVCDAKSTIDNMKVPSRKSIRILPSNLPSDLDFDFFSHSASPTPEFLFST